MVRKYLNDFRRRLEKSTSHRNIAASSKYYMKLSLAYYFNKYWNWTSAHTRTIWYNINFIVWMLPCPLSLTIYLFAFEIMMLLCSAAACGLKREYCYWTLALPSAFNHTHSRWAICSSLKFRERTFTQVWVLLFEMSLCWFFGHEWKAWFKVWRARPLVHEKGLCRGNSSAF